MLRQKKEYAILYTAHIPVMEVPAPKQLRKLELDSRKLFLNLDNSKYSLFESLDLFGQYNYGKFKKDWAAGFQTENHWPTDEFSYDILVSQREDIGDIRTNWELNRHFQFVGLAKNFYLTKDKKYIDELSDLFFDWNKNNLFLHGVQWTSAMEVSIRLISWSYMYAFVSAAGGNAALLKSTENGIRVMADYVLKHRSRFTSANNHLIVEMLGVGLAGILFGYDKWTNCAVRILSEELSRQNTSDGVNREMSLHYQAFVMEAYGIMWRLLEKNGQKVPELWKKYLTKMSTFLADSCGNYGETIVFGDCDEGKILDFSGKNGDYYQYVLQLMGCLLEKTFTGGNISEKIFWLFDNSTIENYWKKERYVPKLVSHYQEGGYTFLRSHDRKLLIGLDHAELGFGSIAAHGHADALSLQVYFEGKPILMDSGTFNYHVPKAIRNEIRSSKAHNTVSIEGMEQAEMLGPFLWGKRYKADRPIVTESSDGISISSKISFCDVVYRRTVAFDFDRQISVTDSISEGEAGLQRWIVSSEAITNHKIEFSGESIPEGLLKEKENFVSCAYNHFSFADCYDIPISDKPLTTIIRIG